jgi:two-component system OmpR family sensor kinase
VAVRVRVEPTAACLEISDRGPGIAPAEQAQIFEPFHRADPTRARATGGAGLGLTIVSAIAHAHGGTVGVVSDPASDNGSGGATFWVRIPLAAADPGSADGAGPPVTTAETATESVTETARESAGDEPADAAPGTAVHSEH